MLNLLETKVVALVVMAVLTLLMGFLPLYVRYRLFHTMHDYIGKMILTGCLCFGAGVLLSIVFLHLMPETQANFRYAMEVGYMKEVGYPVAEISICCGFFFVYLLEEIVHSCVEMQYGKGRFSLKGPTTVEEAKKEAQTKRLAARMTPENRLSTSSNCSALVSVIIVSGRGHDNHAFLGDTTTQTPNGDTRHNVHTTPHCHHEEDNNHGIPEGMSMFGTIVVVAALSFHGIMEGIALGLEEQSSEVWVLMVALCAHKIVLSFSMGMELLELRIPMKPFIVSMLIFSLSSPIGGMIGCLVIAFSYAESPEGILIPTALQAISGGTILYVTFCEILERERNKKEGAMVRFLTMTLGFFLMAGLEAIGGGHDHGHQHPDPFTTLTPPLTDI